MALNSIEDNVAPALTEHAHYVDHSLPTPEPSSGRSPFVPTGSSAESPRDVEAALSEDEEIFEEIGPATNPPLKRSRPLTPAEDGNIESMFHSTGTVYV